MSKPRGKSANKKQKIDAKPESVPDDNVCFVLTMSGILEKDSPYKNPSWRYYFIDKTAIPVDPFDSWQEPDETSPAPVDSNTPIMKKFEYVHPIQPVNEELIRKINEDPYIYIIQSTENEKGVVNSYQYLYHLDISPLLLGENITCITQCYSSGNDMNETSSPRSASIPSIIDTAYCPPVFNKLAISISIVGTLMKKEMLKLYNPISIKIDKLVDLPGISANPDVESEAKYLEYGPYDVMNEMCVPLYISFKFMNFERKIRSPGYLQSEKVKMNFETAFLTDTIPKNELKYYLQHIPLEIEIHDRDVIKESSIEVEKKVYVGETEEDPLLKATLGPPPTEEDADNDNNKKGKKKPSKPASSKKETNKSKKGDNKNGGSAPEEEADMKFIKIYNYISIPEINLNIRPASDIFPFGVCSIKMNEILNRSNEMIKEFDKYKMTIAKEKEAKLQEQKLKEEAELAALFDEKKNEPETPKSTDSDKKNKKNNKKNRKSKINPTPPPQPPTPKNRKSNSSMKSGGSNKDKNGEEGNENKEEIEEGDEENGYLCKCDGSNQIICKNRQYIPKLGIDKAKLSKVEQILTLPGKYMENESRCNYSISIYNPINDEISPIETIRGKKFEQTDIFERIVIILPYKSSIFPSIFETFNNVNRKFIPEEMTYVSYRLSEEEKSKAQSNELDILTGFQVVDDKRRYIIIEGLSDQSMSIMRQLLRRSEPTNHKIKILYNSKIRFTNRLYTNFHLELKTIRLRNPLKILLSNPNVYNDNKVPRDCLEALSALNTIRYTKRLDMLQKVNSFPNYNGLIDIESKFGETVTISDERGYNNDNSNVPSTANSKRSRQNNSRNSSRSNRSKNNENEDDNDTESCRLDEDEFGDNFDNLQATLLEQRSILLENPNAKFDSLPPIDRNKTNRFIHPPVDDPLRKERLKAPLDQDNPQFLEFLQTFKERNFIKPNNEISRRMRNEAKEELQQYQIEASHKDDIYIYSGQKLQCTELQKQELFKKLQEDPTATYTYSKEFSSQTIQLGSMQSIEKLEKLEEEKKWLVPQGFITDAKLPAFSKVTAARAEELAAGFVDEDECPVDERGGPAPEGKPELDLHLPPPQYFGGFKPAKKVGDKLLPSKEKDPYYTQSVFLSGESMIREQKEYEEKVYKDWLSKVVVDDIEFKTYIPKDDKCGDILGLPVKKYALKMVRNCHLPSGKYVPLRPPPKTIFAGEYKTEYFQFRDEPPPSTFLGKDPETGKTIDFNLDNHKHTFIYTRDSDDLRPEERTGPKWRSNVRYTGKV